ncbi:ribose 5-phosphate isomerase A [Deinococcus roseus]|uniref:Ribose-5-phosphate isomerase A n=1 Tax=Deinococcus roseus TaxID=392414 RepID=A0ABQ2CY42_9DEIO|nr:ribose 5-phosphate isomerase A [Deinococcus roseus]GGJ32307.1 ribose-5-phosphate isomerase A [Deinococcus roseus]
MSLEALKEQAAIKAVSHIQSGMRVGLGTGSTAKYAILELARKLKEGELTDIVAVATSIDSERLARENGITVLDLDPTPLDIAIDGADEISPSLDLIKGLGAALLREKIVEVQAREFIVIADHTKLVSHLGQKAPVPVEVVQFGIQSTLQRLARFGEPKLREKNGELLITDNGNYIADLRFSHPNPIALEHSLKSTLGVVDTGFFLGMAARAIVAHEDRIEEFSRD